MTQSQWKEWKTPISNISADEQLEKDLRKEELAKSLGYYYLIVWEDVLFIQNVDIILNRIKEIFNIK